MSGNTLAMLVLAAEHPRPAAALRARAAEAREDAARPSRPAARRDEDLELARQCDDMASLLPADPPAPPAYDRDADLLAEARRILADVEAGRGGATPAVIDEARAIVAAATGT